MKLLSAAVQPLLLPLLLSLDAAAASQQHFGLVGPRQQQGNCPRVHVFGARETTVPQGFGSSKTVVDLVMGAFPGATSEDIIYPAIGDDQYAASVAAGILAIVNQTRSFAARCPNTKLVLVGYSQGAQIMDDAFCGGPDGQSLGNSSVPTPADVGAKVAALIWMGNPRHVAGLPYNVGTATEGGVRVFMPPPRHPQRRRRGRSRKRNDGEEGKAESQEEKVKEGRKHHG
jgi:acetylxylan esterase